MPWPTYNCFVVEHRQAVLRVRHWALRAGPRQESHGEAHDRSSLVLLLVFVQVLIWRRFLFVQDFAMASGIEVFTLISHTLFDPADIINKVLVPVKWPNAWSSTLTWFLFCQFAERWSAAFDVPIIHRHCWGTAWAYFGGILWTPTGWRHRGVWVVARAHSGGAWVWGYQPGTSAVTIGPK